MHRRRIVFTVSLIFVLFLTVSAVGEAQGLSDSNPSPVPQVVIPQNYQASANAAAASNSTDVFFTPQDENTSTTCLFLYNTGTSAAVVGLTTYALSGSQYINTSISVPASQLVRICGDPVSTISASWQAVVFVNFTTMSAYAKMTIPAGVKIEGYVVWNNADVYDPLQVAPTLPIRFSTDPLALFLPMTRKGP